MAEFEEAIIWLKKGKKIRCSFWSKYVYVFWHEGNLVNNHNEVVACDFTLWNWLHNDDWEIFIN